ncbi:hypothetical protein CsatA_002770 [Cannabis sativa]
MAIINTSLCSSPNHSPHIPTLSLSTIQPSKFGLNLVSNEAVVVAAAAEAVTLARAAAQAAKEAVDEVGGGGDMIWSWNENVNSNEFITWRKRNKSLRKEKSKENLKISTGFLSSREEAEYCFILKGNKCAMIAKITEANNVLNRRLSRSPTYDEVAKELKLDVTTVRLVSQRNRPPISLDRAITDRGRMTLQEIMPGPEETIPEKMVKRELLKQEMKKLLETELSEREAHVLRLHFGLNGEYPKSFEEIGRVLKLSRERARQINGIAFTKLQKSSLVKNMRLFIE